MFVDHGRELLLILILMRWMGTWACEFFALILRDTMLHGSPNLTSNTAQIHLDQSAH